VSGGYWGRVLRVDLSTETISIEEIEEQVFRKYIGGSGLGARFLFDETSPATDPLGPDNPLMFFVGPFTGTKVSSSDRFAVVARSPLTGLWAESDCGGRWGGKLHRAGYEGIIITGQAKSPLYLSIDDDQVELRDARHLWGLDTYDLDLGAEMVCIGPAGERGILYAAIMNGGQHARAAGRAGLGAVMGAKRLKAITVKGSMRIPVHDPEGLMASVRRMIATIRVKTLGMNRGGTGRGVAYYERVGDLPIRNWTQGRWQDGAEKITGQTMTDTILVGRYSCGRCPIGCGRVVEVPEGPYATPKSAGPEYETLAALGSLCLIDNLEAIAKMNEICNRYGMDTITAGGVIAYLMEARERELIEDGPTWGDPDSAIEWLHRIAAQKDDLARLAGRGVRAISECLGRRALEFAMHCKGLEFPMHDPRGFFSSALGYATSNRGACHLQAFSHVFESAVPAPELGFSEILPPHGEERKAEMVAKAQNWMALFDALKLCKFTIIGGVQPSHMVEWLNCITGWNMSAEELLLTGERIFNLKRMYNVRLGISRKDDWLPLRILTHRRGEGGSADTLPPLNTMLADYYAYRGWSVEGIPSPELLASLGLEDLV